MSRDYESLFGDWYLTLINVSRVFCKIDPVLYERALERAAGLADLSRSYGPWLGFEPVPTYGRIETHDGANAIEESRLAVSQLGWLYRSTMWVETTGKTLPNLREKRMVQSLAQRHRALAKFGESLHERMGREAYWTELWATVPDDWTAALLHRRFERRPRVSPEQARGVLRVFRSGVPAEYAGAILSPQTLTDNTAKQVIALYDDRIPAELASELVV